MGLSLGNQVDSLPGTFALLQRKFEDTRVRGYLCVLASLSKPRDAYTLWLLDLFRQAPTFYIEVSVAINISLNSSQNIDERMPYLGNKNDGF